MTNFTDPYDSAIYAAVKARFAAELVAYGITNATCDARCPRLAGRFVVPDPRALR